MRFRAWARASFSFGLPLVAVADLACNGGASSGVHVTLAPSLVFPQDTLAGVTSLTLAVYDAVNGVGCNSMTGQTMGVTSSTPQSITPPVLTSTGCAAGAKFCGTFQIGKSTTPRVFSAVADGANSAVIAYGCTQEVINTDNAGVQITMQPFVPPAVCGDMTVEFTEQCDPPSTASTPLYFCDSNCHTVEEYLSTPDTTSGGTIAGKVGDKVRPQFVWPAGGAGNFFATWGDRSPTPQTQIDVRVLDPTLSLLATTALGMEASVASMFIPNDPTKPLPPGLETGNQFAPSVAYSNSEYFVVFQDDDTTPTTNSLDIHLRSMQSSTLVADQAPGMPKGINGQEGDGEPGVQNNPCVATGPQGNLYVVWQDSSGEMMAGGPGAITGRIISPLLSLGTTQYVVSGGTAGTGTGANPIVAGTSTGWVVVWTQQDLGAQQDIWMSIIDATGAPSPPIQVNQAPHLNGIQDHPWVAASPSTTFFAVVWADHGAQSGAATEIAFQRFDVNQQPIAGDQAAGSQGVYLNSSNAGDQQVSPVIAETDANNGLYVAAWYDQTNSQIRARYLSTTASVASGNAFLPNYVNVGGTSADFEANTTATEGHARANPIVAIGGAGPFVVIGWEDLDSSQPGIYARRFPLPPTH